MFDPLSDARVTKELREIGARLAVLANGPPNAELIDAELLAIRVQLRKLSEENAEVGARLREPEDKVSAVSGRVRSISVPGCIVAALCSSGSNSQTQPFRASARPVALASSARPRYAGRTFAVQRNGERRRP